MVRLLVLITLALGAFSQNFTGYPAVSRDSNNFAYVGFNNKLYTFTIPSLDLANRFVADAAVTFADPTTAAGRIVLLSDQTAPGAYTVNTSSNTFAYAPNAPRPESQYPSPVDDNTQQTDAQGNIYNYTLTTTESYITKVTPAGVVTRLNLTRNYNSHGIFSLQNGTLYLTATTFTERSSVNYDYYAIQTSTLAIIDGPVELPNTATAGCPVAPRFCAVNVLDHLSIVDGVVLYVFTNGDTQLGPFRAQINTYRRDCNFSVNVITDESDPSPLGSNRCGSISTTSSPGVSTTSTPGTSTSGPGVSTSSSAGASTSSSPGVSSSSGPSQTVSPSSSIGDNADPDSTCPPRGCGAGLRCCAGQCFSTTQYQCNTRADGLKQLCPLGLLACGIACYNPNDYPCNNGQLGPRFF